MKKNLMATIALAALAGFATGATAQAPNGEKGAVHEQKAAPGGAQKAALGGAMMHQQGGATSPEGTPQGGQPPRGASNTAKPDERVGEGAAQDHGQATPQRGAQEQTTAKPAARAGGQRGGSVQLSQDQRTKIHAVIGKGNAPRVSSDVNISVSIGATLPSNVHVEVLPEDVVEVVPQYEGFEYVLLGDEILIIDPDNLAIVAIVPA
jgi:hypothetical protein